MTGGHAVPARLPCRCTRLRRRCSRSPPPVLAAQRRGASAVAARAAAASKVALARNRRAMRRASFPANEGSAAREAAFRIEPRAPRRGGVCAERAFAARRERPGGHVVPARLLCTWKGLPALLVLRAVGRAEQPGPVATGRAATPCPPGSRARACGFAGAARALRRPTLAARRARAEMFQ